MQIEIQKYKIKITYIDVRERHDSLLKNQTNETEVSFLTLFFNLIILQKGSFACTYDIIRSKVRLISLQN